LSPTEDEKRRSEAAKKAAATRKKNQEAKDKAEREANGPRQDTTPSGPVSVSPGSVTRPPADEERK